jgi:hypothetical protein
MFVELNAVQTFSFSFIYVSVVNVYLDTCFPKETCFTFISKVQ